MVGGMLCKSDKPSIIIIIINSRMLSLLSLQKAYQQPNKENTVCECVCVCQLYINGSS